MILLKLLTAISLLLSTPVMELIHPAIELDHPVMDPEIHILIDPGHGGIDSGATYGDVEEKHINLSLALQLQAELEARGFYVLLTRDKDEALSDYSKRLEIGSRHRRDLLQRGEIVQHFHPNLFLSIHVNAGSEKSKGGQLLYKGEGISYSLAQILQRQLNHITGTNHIARYGKEFYILKKSKHPAVIVEVGYLSNPEEREKLLQRDYQATLVQGLADGIEEYFLVYPVK